MFGNKLEKRTVGKSWAILSCEDRRGIVVDESRSFAPRVLRDGVVQPPAGLRDHEDMSQGSTAAFDLATWERQLGQKLAETGALFSFAANEIRQLKEDAVGDATRRTNQIV